MPRGAQRMLGIGARIPPPAAAAAAAAFTPATITGLKGWYDASTISGSNNDAVHTWPDLSASAKNLTAGDDATLKTAAQAGLNVVEFDGSADYFDSATFGTFSQPNMVFFVVKGVTTGAQLGVFDSVSGTAHAVSIDSRAGQGISIRTSALIKADDTIGAWKVYQAYFNGAASYVKVNGTTVVGPGDIGASALTNLRVGKGGTSTFFGPFGGQMGEILVYNADVASGDATLIRAYLGAKWSIVTT